MPTAYQRYRAAIAGERLPLAWLDLDILDDNIRALAARSGGLPVRVATKSIRCRAVLARILEHEVFRGLMCFSAAEAAWLARSGFDDLLVAYPTVDATDVGAALDEIAGGARITLTVDDAEQVRRLDEHAGRAGTALPLCIDVDMSTRFPGLWFGVRRSPLRDVEAVLALADTIRARPHVRLAGLMGYEAQIAGVPDAVPGKAALNAIVRALKRRSVAELTERRGAVVRALRDAGHELGFVNGGGTGSLETTREDGSVTELTAGSGFFAPALFDGYRSFSHRPAAGFALPIVRLPGPGLFTCHGGGYVASGAAGIDRLPSPHGLPGAELLPSEGAGEVQTPVRYDGPEHLGVGDPILFRHAKAGELCERFAELVFLAEGRVTGRAATYRGEGRTFL